MFNRSAFNQTGFNRPFDPAVYTGINWSGSGTMEVSTIRERLSSIAWDGIGELAVDFVREFSLSATMEGEGTINIDAYRDYDASIQMDGIGTIADINYTREIFLIRAPEVNPFNRLRFNRSNNDRFSLPALHGLGGLDISSTVELVGGIQWDGVGTLAIQSIREKLSSINWNGEGGLIVAVRRDLKGGVQWHGLGTLHVSARRYRARQITFTGDFNPGDNIVIDSKKMKITKNGLNAFSLMQGDFFDITPGGNVIIYSDGETLRTIDFRATFREKFLY
jgi:hypothetical protein